MDTITQAAVRQLVESPARASKGNRVAARQLVAALAGAKALGSDAYAYGVELALACRKDTLKRDTEWQREWGTKVSRRPHRGNHYDSWAAREQYVRGDETIRNRGRYQSYANTVLDTHPQWERNEYGHLRRKAA